MIALLLAQAALPTVAALPRQQLPAQGCAAYLWSVTDRRLVAMAVAEPGTVRIALEGAPTDLRRIGQAGPGGYGFGDTNSYMRGDVTVTLAMTVAARPDLSDGATVPQGTLTVARAGGDALVLPVAGLIGCARPR